MHQFCQPKDLISVFLLQKLSDLHAEKAAETQVELAGDYCIKCTDVVDE